MCPSDSLSAFPGKPLASKVTKSSNSSGQAGSSSSGAGVTPHSGLSGSAGERRRLSGGPRHPHGVTGTGTRGGPGREETAQRRPQAPPRCHRDGHTGRTWERGDGSAAAPGSPTVSQGRAHGADMGERRRLSGGPGQPHGVTGTGTRGRHGREETAQQQPRAPRRCHREGHTGQARVGPAWPWEAQAGGCRQCSPWSLGFVPGLVGGGA